MDSITLGATKLKARRIGFGCYRMGANRSSKTYADQKNTLKIALKNGINLIDTSTNYANTLSETLIGETLDELIQNNKISRQDIILVSKAGYIQGDLLGDFESNPLQWEPFTKYSPGCYHSISPEFLEHQIKRSLTRLKTAYLDVFLIHNPEYFLMSEDTHGHQEHTKDAYYDYLKQCFIKLEELVNQGLIKSYGVSSNTFIEESSHPHFTSLEKLYEISKSISQKNHFQVIQFPMNLFENSAATLNNQSIGTVLEFAKAKNLATLINRPLNARFKVKGGILRLSDTKLNKPEPSHSFFNLLEQAQTFEAQFPEEAAKFGVSIQNIAWGYRLANVDPSSLDPNEFELKAKNQIIPYVKEQLDRLKMEEETNHWAQAYESVFYKLIDAFIYEVQKPVKELTENLKAELTSTKTLSQYAIDTLLSTNGVDVVLLGMRKVDYVNEALQILKTHSSKPQSAYDTYAFCDRFMADFRE